jgi:hypothetical protein
LREQRLGAGKVAGGGALHGVAGQRLNLEIGKRHGGLYQEAFARAKKKPAVDREAEDRPPARVRRG